MLKDYGYHSQVKYEISIRSSLAEYYAQPGYAQLTLQWIPTGQSNMYNTLKKIAYYLLSL